MNTDNGLTSAISLVSAVRVTKIQLVRVTWKNSLLVTPQLSISALAALFYFDTDAALGQQLVVQNHMTFAQLQTSLAEPLCRQRIDLVFEDQHP